MRQLVVGVAIALIVLLLLGLGMWGFRVLTADVKGQGDAHITKSSASNRIAAQEAFEKRYADVVATDRKLDVLASAAKARPNDRTAQQTYEGTVSYCLSAVGDYNADARSYTREAFRAADLPFQIDNLDPTTDCKPSEAVK
jgi:hypothetical protein